MYSLLSQHDLAEGWKLVMNRKKYKNLINEDIYLSQLPPYLWSKINNNNNIVNDKVFNYILKKTAHDNKVIELYNEITSNYKNITIIKDLYKYCKCANISGWLMIKASDIIQSLENIN